MNFMRDLLNDGRTYRLFNVIDDYKRKGLAIEAGLSLAQAVGIESQSNKEYRKAFTTG